MKRKISLCGIILMLTLALTACGAAGNDTALTGLSELNPQVYENTNCGMQFSVPGDWTKLYEDRYNTAFTNADGSISLMVRMELGGMSYFSNDDLAGLAGDVCLDILDEGGVVQSSEVYKGFDAAGIALATGTTSGTDGEAVNAACETMVVQLLPAVRCYVSVLTDPDNYQKYAAVCKDIYDSVELTKTEDELYQMMTEDNEAAAAQEDSSESSVDVVE